MGAMASNVPETIALTADVVLLAPSHTGRRVLVIQRRNDPYAGRWALPGGHLNHGETFAEAARRELREETGLDVPDLVRLDVYDTPGRDPRGRVITVAHLAVLPGVQVVFPGDDAHGARWSTADELLADSATLAFDHHRILTDAVNALDRLHAAIRTAQPGESGGADA